MRFDCCCRRRRAARRAAVTGGCARRGAVPRSQRNGAVGSSLIQRVLIYRVEMLTRPDASAARSGAPTDGTWHVAMSSKHARACPSPSW